MKIPDDIWRLYRREHVIVHTVTGDPRHGQTLLRQAQAWVNDNLAGRVRNTDLDYQLNIDDPADPSSMWCHVLLLKDNMKGEFKSQGSAELFAHVHDYDEYIIVPRNSPADHDIRSYGVKKL